MSDFGTEDLLNDWNEILANAGPVTCLIGGVTASGVWSQRANEFDALDEELKNTKRFTIFTTATQVPITPTLRTVVVRSGVTYFVEAVRADAEGVGVEMDVATPV